MSKPAYKTAHYNLGDRIVFRWNGKPDYITEGEVCAIRRNKYGRISYKVHGHSCLVLLEDIITSDTLSYEI